MWQAIRDFIEEAYCTLLYLAGACITEAELDEIRAHGGDKITLWFRRSKRRLGKFWWMALAAFVIVHSLILYDNIKCRRWGKVVAGALGYIFLAWLIPHILGAW